MLGKARARNHASRPTFAHQPTSKLTWDQIEYAASHPSIKHQPLNKLL
jgi:hypothetical protein